MIYEVNYKIVNTISTNYKPKPETGITYSHTHLHIQFHLAGVGHNYDGI